MSKDKIKVTQGDSWVTVSGKRVYVSVTQRDDETLIAITTEGKNVILKTDGTDNFLQLRVMETT